MNKRESYLLVPLILGIVWILGLPPHAAAQCGDSPSPDGLTWEFDEGDDGFSLGGFVGGLFTPQLVKDTRRIREYVRDPRFGELLKRCGDLRAVDGIFQKALKIAEFNIGHSIISRAIFVGLRKAVREMKALVA